jgi:hypothetical protein
MNWRSVVSGDSHEESTRCDVLALTSFGGLPASFSEFFAFGDSTLDSGWWSGALNGQCGAVPAPCTTANPTKDSKISNCREL